MRSMKKLIALCVLALPVFFLGARESSAIGVCEDQRDFCLAGCTSTSSPKCRSRCLTQYVCCTGESKCPNTGPGGD